MQGTPLRILLDFDRYYDDDDRVELAEEAKAEDYSLLLISMPKIEQDTEFTPDRLQSALQDNDRTEWVFSRLEEQWKQKVLRCSGFAPGAWNRQPVPDFIWKIYGQVFCSVDRLCPLSFQCSAATLLPLRCRCGNSKERRLQEICKIGYSTSIRLGERMKKRSGCVKNEKDLSSEDLSILVQHRMLLGLWSQPILRKRSWMRNISGSARAMTRPLTNGQWIATIGDGSCVRFAAELSRMRRCPITVAREVQTGESVPIVHEMVVANPHSWLDIIRMMVYY